MKLRGITANREIIYFDIGDGPVNIGRGTTILTAKFGSPRIQTQSIVRCPDDMLFAESDFVSAKDGLNFLGYVVYVGGFCIWDPRKEDSITPIRNTADLVFTPNERLYRIDEIGRMSNKKSLSANGKNFKFDRIVYAKEGYLYKEVRYPISAIRVEDIRWGTGVFIDNKELYYGQLYEDGVVSMLDYHPMIRRFNNSYVEIGGVL